MSKVFLSRAKGNVPWGFRLQGGYEYNEPLILSNIAHNSPADGKIDPGDILIEIAGNNATHMTHRDALEVIQRCGNALFLTIFKVNYTYPPNSMEPWRSNRPQPLYNYSQPPISSYNMPSNIPQAPTFSADLISNTIASFQRRQSTANTRASFDGTSDLSNLPAVLAKSLSGTGPKPFTYTPGGVDLSKIRDAARNRRQRDHRSTSVDPQGSEQTMNRRMIVPPEKMNQHHYAANNPIQPFSYARQQQSTAPKKHIQHDTDVITQSRSFQMLQGWISDSEKVPPPPPVAVPSSQSTTNRSAVARAIDDDEQNHTGRRPSANGISNLPSRSFRYLQEQYHDDDNNPLPSAVTTVDESISPRDSRAGLRRSSDAHTPSRSFNYLQNQYHTSDQLPANRSQTTNNRNDLVEIYHKLPPSFRAHEPEAPRYTGSTVPSRSFRFLQMMTQEDEQNDSKPVPGYTKPQQSLINKYDEQQLLTNPNKFNEHPSRSFKYLQELTGEHPSRPQKRTNNLSNDIGASDF